MSRLVTRGLIGLVGLYRRFLSPILGPNCRFRPTCSEYMIQALEKYGFPKGAWLGLRRILHCHPFHPGGYDPLV